VVQTAAGEHSTTAILAAAWDGLAGPRDLPAGLEPGWHRESGPRLDAVTATVTGAPPEAFGAAYEALLALEPARRGRQGSHFTPPPLAAEVVAGTLAPRLHEARGDQVLTICDPAAGGGVFLLAAAAYLTARGVPHRLYGVDRDPLAVAVARLSLWLATADPTVAERLVVGDALLGPVRAGEWPAEGDALTWHELPGFGDGFDAVVGNPPFLGGRSSGAARRRVPRRAGRSSRARAPRQRRPRPTSCSAPTTCSAPAAGSGWWSQHHRRGRHPPDRAGASAVAGRDRGAG